MNAYILVSETSEDPVADKYHAFSIDYKEGELPVIIALKDVMFLDQYHDIVGVVLLPTADLSVIAPEEHFTSIEEFVANFGGIKFKPRS
jgi:hypothetical protein